jgi:hypothetical protein
VVLSGQIWVFDRASTVFWDLGFTWIVGAFWPLGSGFIRVLLYTVCIRRGALTLFCRYQNLCYLILCFLG